MRESATYTVDNNVRAPEVPDDEGQAMNRTQLVFLSVALACFFAVGLSAAALSSSVSSDPTEAVNPDYDVVPVAGEDLEEFESDIDENENEESGGSDTASSGGGADSSDDQASGGQEDDQSESAAEQGQEGDPIEVPDSDSSDGESQSQQANAEQEAQDQQSAQDQSTFGGLAIFDETQLSILDLLTLLVILAVLAFVAVQIYRHRERLRELGGSDEPDGEDLPPEWTGGPPPDENVVFETWDMLVRELDVENRHALTTRECANVASEEGLDREAVETLRLAFEDVRYGGRPVTDERRTRVRELRRRLHLSRNGDSL